MYCFFNTLTITPHIAAAGVAFGDPKTRGMDVARDNTRDVLARRSTA
jgi:hypothetical protein